MEAERRLAFGDFCLDPAGQQLWCGDEVVALSPKAFVVLCRLVEDGGQLVSKEELLRVGWANTHVGDGVLKVIILEIRRALGDDPAAPSFIETVPRRGYRFIASRARQATVPVAVDPRAALVGRDRVLAQLEDRLTSARDRQRQLVFLSGEAGIGKTTVLDAFLARAASDPDLLIARGACLEHYGAAEAYLPVLEAFGRVLREPAADRVIRVLETHAPTWLVQLPRLEHRDDREALRRQLLGVTKERMLREMAEALEALSAVIPVLLVIEDLHWSDYSTLDLLGMLARRQEPARLLVLGSYRSVDVIVAGHPLRALTQELRVRRLCEDIPLAFLREPHVAAYLAQRFGGHAFPPALARAVHQRTDGNPLFMVRVVDELVALRVLEPEDGRWRLRRPLDEIARAVPESLRLLVEKQIARLDPEAQRVLEVASVLGGDFTVASVAAGLATDPLAVEECCDKLEQQGQFLAASELFTRPDGTQVARYHFTHSLYPSVLTDRVSAARRLRLHQRLGEWLEQTYGAHAGVIETQMAHHFEEARDYPRAIEHLRRAADRDVRRWAHQEAAARLTHAVALINHLPAAAAAAVYPLLLDQLGRVRRGLGDLPGTLEACETLATWARAHGEIGWEASAALHRATVIAWVDSEGSRTASMEGLTLSQRVDDPLVRANAQGHAAYWQLRLQGARRADVPIVEAIVAAARTAGDRDLLAQSVVMLALLQLALSDLRAAAQTATQGIEIARDTGNAYMCLWSYHMRVGALLQLGDWGLALAAIDEGLRTGAPISHQHFSSLLRSEAAALHAEALDFGGAAARAREELLHEGLTDAARQAALFELAFALLGLGNVDEAFATFSAPQLAAAAEGTAMPWSGKLRLRQGLAQVWLARGDLDRARAEAEALHALAATADEPRPRAEAARLLAEIALQGGHPSDAEMHLREARSAIAACELPLVEWRLAATAARVHARQRRHADAQAARQRSAALVNQLADSLPPGHELRRSFLEHPALHPVLRPRALGPRS
ncbi:MAG TPA: AAA family ATPase [Candidatus Margulisiibacteriota bacterium]|nr:AAA family ATPase [Candidatus Margulisiibacteriota bacterium]